MLLSAGRSNCRCRWQEGSWDKAGRKESLELARGRPKRSGGENGSMLRGRRRGRRSRGRRRFGPGEARWSCRRQGHVWSKAQQTTEVGRGVHRGGGRVQKGSGEGKSVKAGRVMNVQRTLPLTIIYSSALHPFPFLLVPLRSPYSGVQPIFTSSVC